MPSGLDDGLSVGYENLLKMITNQSCFKLIQLSSIANNMVYIVSVFIKPQVFSLNV